VTRIRFVTLIHRADDADNIHRPTNDPSLEDVDEPFPSGISIITTITTMPESVQVGSSYYTVNGGGYFNIDGTAVSVVSVTVTTIIVFHGTVGTLFPTTTMSVPAYNDIGFLSISGTFTTPEASTISPTTTITAAMSTTTSAAPPAASEWVWVELHNLLLTDIGEDVQQWNIFAPSGSQVVPCGEEAVATSDNLDINVQPGSSQGYPDLTIQFSAHGIDSCEYTGTSSAVGKLTCPGVTTAITCERDSQFGQEFACDDVGTVVIYPDVICYW
jgi:hypothetical protein